MAFSLESVGAAVVYLFHFETMAPEVAVFFYEGHIDGSSGDCGRSIGFSSSFDKF